MEFTIRGVCDTADIVYNATKKGFKDLDKRIKPLLDREYPDDKVKRVMFRQAMLTYKFYGCHVDAADALHSMKSWSFADKMYKGLKGTAQVDTTHVTNYIIQQVLDSALITGMHTDEITDVICSIYKTLCIPIADIATAIDYWNYRNVIRLLQEYHSAPWSTKKTTEFAKSLLKVLDVVLTRCESVVERSPSEYWLNMLAYLAEHDKCAFTMSEFMHVNPKLTFRQAVSELYTAEYTLECLHLGRAYSYTISLPMEED